MARTFKHLLADRAEIVDHLARWMRAWTDTHQAEIGVGDAFACLPDIEDDARARISWQIEDEARWAAEYDAEWAAKSAKAPVAETIPQAPTDPAATDGTTRHAS